MPSAKSLKEMNGVHLALIMFIIFFVGFLAIILQCILLAIVLNTASLQFFIVYLQVMHHFMFSKQML